MAVDQLTGFRDVSKERATMLPGEILATPGAIDHLDVPQEIALNPKNLIPFLASQHARLVDITSRPEIKSMEAEIPFPNFINDDLQLQATALTREEQEALGSFREEARMLLTQAGGQAGTASGGGGTDDLDKRIQGYIDEAVKNGAVTDKGGGIGAVDVLEDWYTGQIIQETEESRKKYLEILAAAKGDPEAVILAMTFRNGQKQMAAMGQMLGAFREKQDGLQALQAELDLKNFKGKLSQADMMAGNVKFASLQSDTSTIMHMIQKTMSDYERTMVSANSLLKTTGESEMAIIRNMRT